MRFSACDMVTPVLCPAHALLVRIPLGPRPSLHRLRCGQLCSPASQLLWQSLTSRDRASSATAPRLPDADRRQLPNGRSRDLPVPAQEASAHARVSDHAGSSERSRQRALTCCLPPIAQRRHPGRTLSRLDGWPMQSPVNASPWPSRTTAHDSGAEVDRYSFIARDLHPLLLAGLPALHNAGLRPSQEIKVTSKNSIGA